MKFICLIFTMIALVSLPLLANDGPSIILAPTVPGCKLTPTISGAAGSYPGREKIVNSNKLARPAGKAIFAQGELLYLTGRILDERCIPVEGAMIELWQTNHEGKYKWSDTGELLSPSAAFAGTGRSVTNNLGEFQFQTIFPGPYGMRAPHLHIRVTHPDLVELSTEVFFARDWRNASDPRLQELSPDLQQRLKAQMQSSFTNNPYTNLTAYTEIILRGKEKYKHF